MDEFSEVRISDWAFTGYRNINIYNSAFRWSIFNMILSVFVRVISIISWLINVSQLSHIWSSKCTISSHGLNCQIYSIRPIIHSLWASKRSYVYNVLFFLYLQRKRLYHCYLKKTVCTLNKICSLIKCNIIAKVRHCLLIILIKFVLRKS